MFISQIRTEQGARAVVAREGDAAHVVPGAASVLELARAAWASGRSLADEIRSRGRAQAVDLAEALRQGRVLAPVDHPDPSHLHLTGTGLTHLGSASTRDAMHAAQAQQMPQTDSMRMFHMGVEGGKPAAGMVGVQPEWFYKGNGHAVTAPEAALASPAFAQDGGEEPEVAGIYWIADDGTPCRLGFALGNEFSDHVVERGNYLWLAHSKLRPASFGPELLLGELPAHVEGVSRVRRRGEVIWEQAFVSGEANMSHSVANLEHHHFKYGLFRHPGDVHVHFFGTATLSFADGVRTEDGDVFEIDAPQLGLPLRNAVAASRDPDALVRVKPL